MMTLFTQTRPRWSIYGCLTMVLPQTLKPRSAAALLLFAMVTTKSYVTATRPCRTDGFIHDKEGSRVGLWDGQETGMAARGLGA